MVKRCRLAAQTMHRDDTQSLEEYVEFFRRPQNKLYNNSN
jgi:hypothetical protein